MLIGCDIAGERVMARDANRAASYQCPACRWALVLKVGRIKIPHFAHVANAPCYYGRGETAAHLHCKMALFDALNQQGRVPILEDHYGLSIPDVTFTANGVRIAIEVQRSGLTVDQITERTRRYAERRMPLLWLLLAIPHTDTDDLAPRQWQKWLHTLYFGRVYCWQEQLTVQPIHFRGVLIGEDNDFGSSMRYSKRYREADLAPRALDLLTDFRAQFHTPNHPNLASVPPLWLYRDTQRAWWSKTDG